MMTKSIIKIYGKDKLSYLQGIITNDIYSINNSSIYSAILTPQGKFLNDFFLIDINKSLFIECDKNTEESLVTNISKYKLKKDVHFEQVKDWTSLKILDVNLLKLVGLEHKLGKTKTFNGLIFYIDPRSLNLGVNIVGEIKKITEFKKKFKITLNNSNDIETRRIQQCIPDPKKDLEVNKSFILEYNFDKINGVSFSKGCYVGQENTARLKYRGTLKRALKVVKLLVGKMPTSGDKLFSNDIQIGVMKSSVGIFGLAIIKTQVYIDKNKKIYSNNNLLEII